MSTRQFLRLTMMDLDGFKRLPGSTIAANTQIVAISQFDGLGSRSTTYTTLAGVFTTKSAYDRSLTPKGACIAISRMKTSHLNRVIEDSYQESILARSQTPKDPQWLSDLAQQMLTGRTLTSLLDELNEPVERERMRA